MDFTKEITEFPSEVFRMIYSNARELVPLEKSLSTITDEELRASCREYHAFLMDWLSDFYDNPEEYGIKPYELETFLNGRKLNGVKRLYPSKTKAMLARVRNCVDRYQGLFCRLGVKGELTGDYLLVKEEENPALEKAVNTSASPVSLEKRLQALKRVGLVRTEQGFYSEKHPGMFKAMVALAQKTKGTCSGFPYFLFAKADFRNIKADYIPVAEDYLSPLTKERRETAFQLHKLALELGCRTDISTFLKVNYKYKGTEAMMIDSYEGLLSVRIVGVYSWDDWKPLMDRLYKESEEFRKYANRHLWRCSGCATTHLGTKVNFLGQNSRVCGGGMIGFTFMNPAQEDMDYIRYFLSTRCEIINEQKKPEKKQIMKGK